jgi:hypothetical protein
MFTTGLVEEVGHIASYTDHPEAARVDIRGRTVVPGARPGASIAVNAAADRMPGNGSDQQDGSAFSAWSKADRA